MYFISNTSLYSYSWWGKGRIWLTNFWNCMQYWTFVLWYKLDGCPLLNFHLYIGGFCAKGFLQCLYTADGLYCLNCFTMLLIFMLACWCKLAISTECLTVTAIFSFNSQFDICFFNDIAIQEGETKGGKCVSIYKSISKSISEGKKKLTLNKWDTVLIVSIWVSKKKTLSHTIPHPAWQTWCCCVLNLFPTSF